TKLAASNIKPLTSEIIPSTTVARKSENQGIKTAVAAATTPVINNQINTPKGTQVAQSSGNSSRNDGGKNALGSSSMKTSAVIALS
ncbi:hypothetical protein RZS08_09090, partial [Arthrospira platensis SPKY1]|nr:hypothetical protein [Arthrospira platensis SPKY1]